MINAVAETVRERDHLFREARVITTQQRYTAYMLSLLPIRPGRLDFYAQPEYITQFLRTGTLYPDPHLCYLGYSILATCAPAHNKD